MKIEILFPELANLFGDSGNARILRASLPDAEFIETDLETEPAFLTDPDVGFTLMGSLTERGQRLVLSRLSRYQNAMADRLKSGLPGLWTGNSFEILGEAIETDTDTLTGLGLADFRVKQTLKKRFNSLFLGTADDLTIVGFDSRFSHTFPGTGITGFAEVKRGTGLNENCSFEGIRLGSLVGTYLLGPLLVMNPPLLKKLLGDLGFADRDPAFYGEAMEAYRLRCEEFSDHSRKLD